MTKLTYAQIVLEEGEPPIDCKKLNQNKIYARFTTIEPVETFDIEDLREILHDVSDDIDIIVAFKPGTDDFPCYQIWIAVPKNVMLDKLNRKFFEVRNFVKHMDKFLYSIKFQDIMEPSLQEMMAANKTAYKELTEQIKVADSVTPRYAFNVTFEEAKRILEVMFTTGHTLHKIVSHNHKSEIDFWVGFALDDSESDKIYFRLKDDEWEIVIYSSTTYCHFIKVAEIALPGIIISKCIKFHTTANEEPYLKCPIVQDYLQEHRQKSTQSDMDFDSDLVNFLAAANCDVDILTYRYANAAKVQTLIDKINNMIRNGFPIYKSVERAYGYKSIISASENISCIYTIGHLKPEAQIKIIGPAYLDISQDDQTYSVTVYSRTCLFSDIVRRILGDPDKEQRVKEANRKRG